MQTVVCMRWGDRFPVDYVNRLYRGVMRNVARPTRFIAFTDDPRGLDAGHRAARDPADQAARDGPRRQPWRKLALWSPRYRRSTGDLLFLDLDVVVVGPLDAFFDFEPGKLAHHPRLARDGRTGNSSVMRVAGRAARRIWSSGSRPTPLEKRRLYSNEQVYLCRENRVCRLVFWPKEWCPGFKAMMLPRFPANLVKNVKLPEGARIVVFTGHPRPHEALRGEWPAPGYKKIYKRVRPVTWLDDHWR